MIASTYNSLNFDERQAKWNKMKAQAEDHAARVFQVFARCKFAKRHLLKQVQHFKGFEDHTDHADDEAQPQLAASTDGDGGDEHVNPRYTALAAVPIRAEENARSLELGELQPG